MIELGSSLGLSRQNFLGPTPKHVHQPAARASPSFPPHPLSLFSGARGAGEMCATPVARTHGASAHAKPAQVLRRLCFPAVRSAPPCLPLPRQPPRLKAPIALHAALREAPSLTGGSWVGHEAREAAGAARGQRRSNPDSFLRRFPLPRTHTRGTVPFSVCADAIFVPENARVMRVSSG